MTPLLAARPRGARYAGKKSQARQLFDLFSASLVCASQRLLYAGEFSTQLPVKNSCRRLEKRDLKSNSESRLPPRPPPRCSAVLPRYRAHWLTSSIMILKGENGSISDVVPTRCA